MTSPRAAVLLEAWPRLTPLRRVAAWRRLTRAEAAEAAAALPAAGRWLLYLGCDDGALAPLTETGERGFRRVTPAERAALRGTLA